MASDQRCPPHDHQASGRRGVPRPLPPLYYRVFHTLEQRIRDQHYKLGDRLPSEDELCREFTTSRITIRAAVGRLVADGLVVRRRGSGTFINRLEERRPTPVKFTAALEDLFAHVQQTRTSSAQVLSELPPSDVAELMRLPEGETVVVVRRIRTFQDHVFSLTTNYLPRAIGVRVKERDLYRYPLLRLLEERLGVTFRHAEQTIEARLANEDVAKALEIGFGDPVLFVERLMFGDDDRPLEVVRSYYRGDVYRYQLRLERSRTAPFRWQLSHGTRR
jgi:DNA-binding GntR family transcriptional regulator